MRIRPQRHDRATDRRVTHGYPYASETKECHIRMTDDPGPVTPESVDDELARLRRLAVVEALLTTVVGTLDVREVFARVVEIAGRVLHQDAITVWVFSDDREHAVPYGAAGAAPGESE